MTGPLVVRPSTMYLDALTRLILLSRHLLRLGQNSFGSSKVDHHISAFDPLYPASDDVLAC